MREEAKAIMSPWFIKPADETPEPLMRRLSSVQKALVGALNMELQTSDDRVWAAFMPQGGVDPIEVVFCPLGSNEIVGSLKIGREGEITDRTGLGESYIV